ncbi:MAG: aminoacetone oxidase family FAD-binding enzyme [Bacteroidaceae bacterium]|nr:aminoacetone oxidase family FAD-binding enzyme [Bacteroidaceae bacterium]
MKIAIIGAGAAGCFCAVNLKRMHPAADVSVIERSSRPLAKVAITGGGRCNLTNSFRDVGDLRDVYPRGARLMQRLFRQFSPNDTMHWWEEAGVPLTVQDDQCVFPCSQSAMQVVNTLLQAMRTLGVRIRTEAKVTRIQPTDCGFDVTFNNETERFDKVVVTTGGSPRSAGLDFLPELKIEPPVPSLFALNINDEPLHELTGIVVTDTPVSIAGTKFRAQGELLITHFGLSGPAMLRLSSHAARHLAEQAYRVTLCINWMQGRTEDEVRGLLRSYGQSRRQVTNLRPEHLTARHWSMLLARAGVPESRRWDTLPAKELNRLTAVLTADTYATAGRRTYKTEFVTCGGVSLSEIDANTLECKRYPGLYLAGEVLDVDAVTGGFNLQAAWTMGYVVGCAVA